MGLIFLAQIVDINMQNVMNYIKLCDKTILVSFIFSIDFELQHKLLKTYQI